MQFTKIIKHIILLLLISFIWIAVSAQETDDDMPKIKTDTVRVNTKKEKNFKLFSIFKRNDKSGKTSTEDEDEENEEEINSQRNDKKDFFSFLKKKEEPISNELNQDDFENMPVDTGTRKEKFSLFKKNKNDSAKVNSSGKPKHILPGMWNKMNVVEQDSLLKAWDDFDRERYKKRYAFRRKEVEIALKKDRNFLEKQIYNRSRTKPFRHNKKIINKKNSRIKKTILYDRLNKSESVQGDSISDEKRYQIVNKRYKREAKKEAIRKNKVVIKYNRKEERLKRRYELNDNEMIVLNKGRGMKLKGTEVIVFKKAQKKQAKLSKKLLLIRKKRIFELQNENVQKRMKENNKKNNQKDKETYNHMYKKKNKKKDRKHDSNEYPKRYFK